MYQLFFHGRLTAIWSSMNFYVYAYSDDIASSRNVIAVEDITKQLNIFSSCTYSSLANQTLHITLLSVP